MDDKLVQKFNDELERLRLSGQSLLDLLCLNEDLSLPVGCSGPRLADAWKAWQTTAKNTESTREFMKCLQKRATHVSGALEQLKNDKHGGRELAEERHKFHNNAMKFIKRDPKESGQRFLHLLDKSVTRTWDCCNTTPIMDLSSHRLASQNRADESAPSPPKEGCTQNDNDNDDDNNKDNEEEEEEEDDDDDDDILARKARPAATQTKLSKSSTTSKS
ncbi:hypothetical protein LEL_10540 [Akanthomyces lecanii RCEF 1005]|uniref:Uncharacterized protein n=1 Tax=Akanthomyces lecanii RCEF 1005 TaxID=1081108 RepID=A0A167XKN1_CORDF|nr:hypothetical protein LEL_10540 [Akanthomyces lecanii RCEF 1005]